MIYIYLLSSSEMKLYKLTKDMANYAGPPKSNEDLSISPPFQHENQSCQHFLTMIAPLRRTFLLVTSTFSVYHEKNRCNEICPCMNQESSSVSPYTYICQYTFNDERSQITFRNNTYYELLSRPSPCYTTAHTFDTLLASNLY